MAKAKPNTPAAGIASNPPQPAGGPSFEQSIEQVELIIDRIERGEQGLERSITDYERGAALLKQCREVLARSEQRIQEIEADLSRASAPPATGPAAPPVPKGTGSKNPSTPPPARTDDEADTPF